MDKKEQILKEVSDYLDSLIKDNTVIEGYVFLTTTETMLDEKREREDGFFFRSTRYGTISLLQRCSFQQLAGIGRSLGSLGSKWFYGLEGRGEVFGYLEKGSPEDLTQQEESISKAKGEFKEEFGRSWEERWQCSPFKSNP